MGRAWRCSGVGLTPGWWGLQESGSSTWTYPSEKMFYNAMRRKGWEPDAGDMQSVVMIHNVVNERAWKEVLEWEKLHERCAQQQPLWCPRVSIAPRACRATRTHPAPGGGRARGC